MISFWSRQRLLVLAPHPDDEVIGCGGLISRVVREGGEVYVIVITVGDLADDSPGGRSYASERQAELIAATEFLGVRGHYLALPGEDYHLRLDLMPQHVLGDLLDGKECPLSIVNLKPTMVSIPSIGSYNQDHRAAAKAAITALRPRDVRKHSIPRLVVMYEQVGDAWSPVPQPPRNLYVELDSVDLDRKIDAMSLYATQRREHPHTRSEIALRSLAKLRGAEAGCEYAEAYSVLRGVF